MYYFAFALFFALNLSLWFILPSLLLKNIIITERKKDKKIKTELLIYGGLTIVYLLIYILLYRYFNISINDIVSFNDGTVKYLTTEIWNLSILMVSYLIISLLYIVYTFLLGRKLFKHRQINLGYTVCLLTGFFNIITYWFSNTVLKLNLYSFPADKYILNSLMKIDNELLLFLFPALVFINFAFSFLEKS